VRNLDIAAIGLELLLIVFLFVDLINGGALLRRRLHGGVLGTGHRHGSPGAPFPRNPPAAAQGPRRLGRPDTSPGWRIRVEVDSRICMTNRALADTRFRGEPAAHLSPRERRLGRAQAGRSGLLEDRNNSWNKWVRLSVYNHEGGRNGLSKKTALVETQSTRTTRKGLHRMWHAGGRAQRVVRDSEGTTGHARTCRRGWKPLDFF
jgi:hypothetical protein